jgi:cytochrome c556
MAVEMRDAAAELSKTSRSGDEAGFKTALDRLGKSCDDCHEVFHAE